MGFQYYFFDLDGTLTDPGLGITNSAMYALDKFDIHVKDRKELYSFIGPPLGDSFRNFFGFSEDQTLQAVAYFRERYSKEGLFENEVYQGIQEMLSNLKKADCTVALATSKPHEFAVKILEHFDLYRYFDFISAATMDGRVGKKADIILNLLNEMNVSDTNSVLMIGDRYHDIEGAKANNLKSCGVLWGYGSEAELRDAGADYIIGKPDELLALK